MSAATDMQQAPEEKAKQKRWTPGKAVQAYNERRKLADQRRAEFNETRIGSLTIEEDAKQRKPGRPPRYRPEYCQTVLELSEKGFSHTAIAGKLRICREQLYTWAHKYPQFANSLKVAKAIRASALETEMLAEDSGPRINARIFALKNAAPEEWSDRQNIEINQTVNVAVQFSTMLDGLCSTVIDGVLSLPDATQSNDINTLEYETIATEATVPPFTRALEIEREARESKEEESDPPLPATTVGPSISISPPLSISKSPKKSKKSKNNSTLSAKEKKAAYMREYMAKRRASTRSQSAPLDGGISED